MTLNRRLAKAARAAAALAAAWLASDPVASLAGERRSQAAGPAGIERAAAVLPLAAPRLDLLDPAVREQLARKREEVEALHHQSGWAPAQLGSAYGGLGQLYHAYELWPAAEICYLNAAGLSPEDVRWPYLLGHVYFHLGDFECALWWFDRARALRPDDLPTQVWLGEMTLDLDRPEESAAYLERALARDPTNARIHFLLGQLAAKRSEPREAADHFEAALTVQPGANQIEYPLALAYRQLGQLDSARDHLGRRGTVAPQMADPLVDDLRLLTTGARYQLERGNTAFMAGHYRSALEYFKRALAADPQSTDARLNFAASLARLGDREPAIQGLREVLLQDPQKAMAHFNLGTLLAQKGDDAEAIRHYRRALEIDPGYASVQFNLANALRRVGRCHEALGPYAAYSRLYPANPEPRYGEAKCLAELGRYREAATKLEEACAVLPESALLADALARLLAASPDPSVRDARRAVDLARQALAAGGTVLRAETLAMALAEAGDFKSAIATQKAALEAAERGGRKDLLARFQTTLALYERHEPCRQPWPRQDAGEPPP